jgi:hypothetical protein
MNRTLLSTFCLSLLATTVVGCTKEDSDSSGSSSSSASSSTTPFRTDCGTVIDNALVNPVKTKNGILGKVTVAGPNLLVMTTENDGEFLVKLQSLGVPYGDAEQSGSESMLENLAKEDAYFFKASDDCTTSVGQGQTGFIGQLFTASGKSYSETLLNNGYGKTSGDPCGGSLLTSCYRALQEDAESKTAGELEAFLWKPVSDSNGKLAIHSSPSDTTVIIGGETGTTQGGGNGYAQLGRFSKPGCGYGKNVRVTVVNSKGVPYRINGQDFLTVPDGCGRYCLKGGAIVPCPKR